MRHDNGLDSLVRHRGSMSIRPRIKYRYRASRRRPRSIDDKSWRVRRMAGPSLFFFLFLFLLSVLTSISMGGGGGEGVCVINEIRFSKLLFFLSIIPRYYILPEMNIIQPFLLNFPSNKLFKSTNKPFALVSIQPIAIDRF